MRTLKVNSGSRSLFQLIDYNQLVAQLNYPNWYSYTAEIFLFDGLHKFDIRMEGFWQNNISMWNFDRCIAQSKMNWSQSVIITIDNQEYLLKMTSFNTWNFTLSDSTHQEILSIVADANWFKTSTGYDIQIADGKEKLFAPEELLFIIHNCNYFMAMTGGGITAAIAATI